MQGLNDERANHQNLPALRHILELDKTCRETVYRLQTRDRLAFPSMSLALHEVLRRLPFLWGQAAATVSLADVQASLNKQPNPGRRRKCRDLPPILLHKGAINPRMLHRPARPPT